MTEIVNGLDLETGIFSFPGLREGGFIDIPLSPTERDMIRPYGAEGQPIWKIVKGLLDYRAVLIENAASLDLADPLQLEQARQLFAEAKAILWMHDTWTRVLGAPELANANPLA